MGVRPPSNDLDGPDLIEFGIPALDAKLDEVEVSYPIDRATLKQNHGTIAIPYNAAEETVRLATLLEDVDQQTFDSEQQLLNAVHPVLEEHRASASTGIIGRLRRLVPF